MTKQLKPCPFCGGSAVVNRGPTYLWYVQCQECRIDGEIRPKKSEAIEAWNRRVHPAQPGAEPAPSAVVCGRCDGTGLDARYCNYQCEKCDGSGQAGAEPVAWMTHESRHRLKIGGNSKGAVPVHKNPSHTSCIPLYTHPPARVPLTEGELLSMWSGGDERFMRPVLGKNKILAFALAVIAAYEAKNGIGGGK